MKQADPTITLLLFDKSKNKLKDPTHIPDDETASEYATMTLEKRHSQASSKLDPRKTYTI